MNILINVYYVIMKILIFLLILTFTIINKSFSSGLAALSNWNDLKIECYVKDETRKYEIKLNENVIIQKKWDNFGFWDKFQITSSNENFIIGTLKIEGFSNTKYISIDRNNSEVRLGSYVINLKNEKVFTEHSRGNCIKDLD